MKKYFLILVMVSIALMAVGVTISSGSALCLFDISPNPMEDYTVISVGFDRMVDVNIYVEDFNGTIVRTLFSGRSNKEITLNWNRVADDGSYVPNGTYRVVVSYLGRYTSTKKTLILK